MSPNFALCFQSCLSSLKMALKTLWKMLCIAVHSSKCGVLKPGLANFLWLYIASSIHQFMIFMVALPSPKQPKAAETSEDLQVNKLAGGKSYNYKYHTLGKQVWKNVSSFHQFSHLRETACEGYKSDRKSQSLHLQTLWDQASYRVLLSMIAMASFFGVVALHSRWTSLSISQYEPICSILWSILNLSGGWCQCWSLSDKTWAHTIIIHNP